MIVGLQGTKAFSDYTMLMRSMGTALSMLDKNTDKVFTVFTSGAKQTYLMALEFMNITENTLKSVGVKPKLIKISEQALEDKVSELDYFIFLANKKEPVSHLVDLAIAKDTEYGVYRDS